MKAEVEGKIEVCFAGTGVLVKLHMPHDQAELAKRLLESMRQRAIREDAPQLLPNIDAMRVWIALQQDDLKTAQICSG